MFSCFPSLISDCRIINISVHRFLGLPWVIPRLIFNAEQYINCFIHAFYLLLLVVNHSTELLPVISTNRLTYTVIQAVGTSSAFSRQRNNCFRTFFSKVCHVLMTEYATVCMTDNLARIDCVSVQCIRAFLCLPVYVRTSRPSTTVTRFTNDIACFYRAIWCNGLHVHKKLS